MKSKFEEVQEYIIKKIEDGIFADGERLPSCRQLSTKLGVNKITINKAYSALEEKHYVYSVPRSGFYVIARDKYSEPTNLVADFTRVCPEEKMIPFRAFTHVMNNSITLHKVKLFSENDPMGLFSLRETLCERFAIEGIYSDANEILISHGSQQGIDLIFQLMFRNKQQKLLIESPTYSLAIDRACSLGIALESIERRASGVSLTDLEAIFEKGEVSCFYIVPRYHNPTGYSMSEPHKKSIVSLCQQYGVWIIEDDYLGDLGRGGDGLPLHYYDIDRNVIYLRSFSKTFMPGIRIGAMTCPKSLIGELTKLKKEVDLGTSILTQSALDIFIKSGMYDQHIKKIQGIYKRKLERVRKLLSVSPSCKLTYYVPKTGIFVWLEFSEEVNVTALIEKLNAQGILIKASSHFYRTDDGQHQVRLCIASVPEEELYKISLILNSL